MKSTKEWNVIWHSGNPPHAGWWMVSPILWGWFDGWAWHGFAPYWLTACAASRRAAIGAPWLAPENIRWCNHWPRRARVPRLDPRKMQAEAATHGSA